MPVKSFTPTLFPPPSRGRVFIVFRHVTERFFIELLTISEERLSAARHLCLTCPPSAGPQPGAEISAGAYLPGRNASVASVSVQRLAERWTFYFRDDA